MDNAALVASDAIARKRIETETDVNFFVEAGAGSGKTTSLVRRMVSMVAAGIDIRKVAAITYTKAAAREFYLRFQKSLDEHRRTATDETLKERFGRALVDIDLCFMNTIDAFCNLILGEHPAPAELPLDIAVLSDEKLMSAYRREWLAMKRGGYGKALQTLYRRFSELVQSPEAVFECSIRTFMDTRENSRPYAPFSAIDTDECFAGERLAFISVAKNILAHPEAQKTKRDGSPTAAVSALKKGEHTFESKWSENLPRVIDLLKSIDGLRLTQDPEDLGIMDSGYFEYPEGRKRDYVLHTADTALYRKLKELQFSAAVELMDKFSRAAASRLKANGELGFFDYILYLRNMLREDAENGAHIIRHISKRHSYFLIDEFQDTNPLQAEIFFYLAAREPDADWTKCVPRPGSLFIVGDPKQSIYRFQGADVSSFLRVKKLFAGDTGAVLGLSRNYRSSNELREWFNGVFTEMLPASTDIQSAFTPIPPNERANVSGSLSGVYKYISDNNNDPCAAADMIYSLVHDEAETIAVFENGEMHVRRIRYDDFMLITRTKTKLKEYMSAFSARGIPFRIEGKTAFSECAALSALAAAMAAVAAPADSLSVYSALKTGLFSVSDGDILEWREAGRRLSLLETEGTGTVAEALEALRGTRLAVGGLTPSAAVQKAAEKLKILELSSKNKLEYYYFALELLRGEEVSGAVFSLEGTAAFLKDILKNVRERELHITEKAGGVHIANLHKVKGLEAPIVILACPGNGSNRSAEFSTVYGEDGAKTVFFKIAKRGWKTYAETLEQTEAKEAEAAQLAAEELRLKYVAATRAESALIVSALENEESSSNTWREFALACKRQMKSSDALPPPETAPAEIADWGGIQAEAGQSAAQMKNAAALTYCISRPSLLKVKSKTSSEDEYDDMIASDIEKASRRRHASLIGTMTHRMMELLVLSGGNMDTETLVRTVMSEYDVFGETGKLIESAIRTAAERMKHGGYPQTNGLPQDLLAELASADGIMCETPLCVLTEDPAYMQNGLPTLLHGIIDLAYEKDGVWHIIDYKTTIDPSDLDEHYMLQLASYSYGFERVTGHKAEAKVYHIGV